MLRRKPLLTAIAASLIGLTAFSALADQSTVSYTDNLNTLPYNIQLLDHQDNPTTLIKTDDKLRVEDGSIATGMQYATISLKGNATQSYTFTEQYTNTSVTLAPGESKQISFELDDNGGEAIFLVTPTDIGKTGTSKYTISIPTVNSRNPAIELTSAPTYGTVQYLSRDDVWTDMSVGVEYDLVDQVRFVPDTDTIQGLTKDVQIGSFDSNPNTYIFNGTARVSDWGTVSSNGKRATWSQSGLTIVTYMSTGEKLVAQNRPGTATGSGIGGVDGDGLVGVNDHLIVAISGDNLNQINFHLDGLGGCYVKGASCESEVRVRAYRANGTVIDTQGDFRDAKSPEGGEAFQDDYLFTFDEPVKKFDLYQTGRGSYVAQNMTISRTLSDDLTIKTIGANKTEVNHPVDFVLNYSTSSDVIDVDALYAE